MAQLNTTISKSTEEKLDFVVRMFGFTKRIVVESAIREFYEKEVSRFNRLVDYVGLLVNESDLSENAQLFINAARRQSKYLAQVLQSESGRIKVIIWADDLSFEHVIKVACKDKLTPSERKIRSSERYLEMLSWRETPSPFTIDDAALLNKRQRSNIRIFFSPEEVVWDYYHGEITATEAINAIGDALVEFCQQEEFEII